MTAPHYYASTSGILVDRFLKYGLFPFAYGAGLVLSKDHNKATRYAQVVCLAGSSAITTYFLGQESHLIDVSGKQAVSAAMGIDPDKIEFSDYKNSSNIIVKKAHDDLVRLQYWRYGTDLLFILPGLVEMSYGKLTGKKYPPSKDIVASLESRHPENPHLIRETYRPDKYSAVEKILQGHTGWAMSPYAGKAAYWVYETFFVDKTAYYDVVKLAENLEATGKDIAANDLKGIYQRARHDRKLPMVSLTNRKENDALRGLFDKMAGAYNRHDGKFGIPEIVYLIGENKINIHAGDGKTFSPEAVQQSYREIDKVLAAGLKGIREENRQQRKQSGYPGMTHPIANGNRTFIERIGNKTVNTIQNILENGGMIPKTYEEHISERDPTNLLGLHEGMGR